jgi:hypothetical protein
MVGGLSGAKYASKIMLIYCETHQFMVNHWLWLSGNGLASSSLLLLVTAGQGIS